MKFGQLIEYNMRNIFHTENVVDKLFPDSFLKNQNWAYLWSNILNLYTFCFNCLPSWDYWMWLKLSCRPFAFTSYKAFLKNNKRSDTSLLVSFSAWFFKKNVSVAIFYYLTKVQCLVVFVSWDIGQYVYCNCLLTRLWRCKFWN